MLPHLAQERFFAAFSFGDTESRGRRWRFRAMALSRSFVPWRGSAIKKFWNQPDEQTEKGHLTDWLENAESLKISALASFFRTRFDGLFAWYAYPISTGPLEGMNNKIKTLKRRSYGFCAPGYFLLKILNAIKHGIYYQMNLFSSCLYILAKPKI